MSVPPKSAVAAFFDREADTWDGAHGPESGRAGEFAARAAYLRTLCGMLGKPTVVDLGCGTGRQLIDLADRIEAGVGLDLSPEMVARAEANAARLGADAKIVFRTGDTASARPEQLGRFGLALFVGSLEHAPDQAALLAAAAGLLEPQGRLVVIMPHPRNPGVLLACRGGAVPQGVPLRHLTPRALAALGRTVGLRMETVSGLPYRASGAVLAAAVRRWPLVAGAYAARFALA